MGLSQTLHSTSTGGAGAASTSSPFCSLELPTMVQLFCDHEPLQFHYHSDDYKDNHFSYSRNKNTNHASTTSLLPPWASLLYQTHLGVWNVRVFADSNDAMDHSLLFQIPVRKWRKFSAPTF
ncbi:hypothetical protein ACA910_010271 [Epithemia clementina (nom. ined.)]